MARITFEIEDDLLITLQEYASFLGVSLEDILKSAVKFEASILSNGISLILFSKEKLPFD